MTTYQSKSLYGHTNSSSLVTVTEDLVAHRGLWRKFLSSFVCIGFVVTAWILIIFHAVNFTNETIFELSISISVLIGGQYLITGFVDAFIYYKRWNKSLNKTHQHSKVSQESKEAWVCMRVTFSLLGFSPLVRYFESIVVIIRMIRLEKLYMGEIVALMKDAQQPTNLSGGSLFSGPTNVQSLHQNRKLSELSNNPNRMQELHVGIQQFLKARRQFKRTEYDSAIVALTSGVMGAGPFIICQGILFCRREAMSFIMSLSTRITLLVCFIFGLLWLTASLTHFYPASHQQTELEFNRGVGQVPAPGLILLFFAHLVHVTLRCFTLILFTAQFQAIILIVVGSHFFIVLISIWISRSFTKFYYYEADSAKDRKSIKVNLVSDLFYSYVGLYEFCNARAKYTRTRYLIYYALYYLENAVMIGVWYAYYEFPEVWYYLPILLVVICVQFLGFILLQIYLYLFSKPKRKTTLCGYCFAHKDPADVPVEHKEYSRRSVQLLHQTSHSNSRLDLGYGEHQSMALSDNSQLTSQYPMSRRTAGSIFDPIFGKQIAQSAAPINVKRKRQSSTVANANHRLSQSQGSTSVHNGRRQSRPSSTRVRDEQRMYKTQSRLSELNSHKPLSTVPSRYSIDQKSMFDEVEIRHDGDDDTESRRHRYDRDSRRVRPKKSHSRMRQ